ncbi:hypothetical protein ACFQZK_02200 [Rhodococcus aetherivorans]
MAVGGDDPVAHGVLTGGSGSGTASCTRSPATSTWEPPRCVPSPSVTVTVANEALIG